ncbi:MAG: hypothetical protein J0J15_31320, partial [Mesorhizobium sp.]|nr:hypothetical protein [Mesorhizobium sp.]
MKKSRRFSRVRKILLRRFDGSCKGSGTNGEWGRPVENRGKGRPMLENNSRLAIEAAVVAFLPHLG